MPWNYRDYIQLGLLICCVPLQFYLSSHKNNSENSSKEILGLIDDLSHFKQTWFTVKPWKIMWTNFLSWFVINVLGVQNETAEESPAVEVFKFRKKYGLVVKTNKVRKIRPPEVWFRVGQVVEHLSGRYRGVIVEWDYDEAKESSMPSYRILLDEASVREDQIAGIIDVDQDHLYLLKNTRITNQFLSNYFSAYDGSQYIPLRWLQIMYPKD